MLNSFVSNGAIAPKGVTAPQVAATPNFPISILQMLGDQPDQTPTMLKASINWIILDEQFKYVSGGFDMVGETGVVKDHNASTIPTIDIPKNGYIYVYCSNESNYDVFFDNLQLIHTRGQVLEETHYYPFGLTMAGITSKAAGGLKNKENTFQNQRFDDDLDLNWVQFKWRNHDPQIGRFVEIDPLSEKYDYNSTYAFSENKVTSHVELEGLEAERVNTDTDKPGFLSGVWSGVKEKANNLGNVFMHPVTTVENALKPKNYLNTLVNIVTYGLVDLNKDIKTVATDGVNGLGKVVGGKMFEVAVAAVSTGASKLLTKRSGLGDLTKEEVKIIQQEVNLAERPIEVVGSAAQGTRRGVGTNKPIGKGEGTKSDIDYVAPPSSIPYYLQNKLPGIDPKTGIIPGYGNPFEGPIIKFEPFAKPQLIPKKTK